MDKNIKNCRELFVEAYNRRDGMLTRYSSIYGAARTLEAVHGKVEEYKMQSNEMEYSCRDIVKEL